MIFISDGKKRNVAKRTGIIFLVLSFFTIVGGIFIPDYVTLMLDKVEIKFILILFVEILVLLFCTFYYYSSYRYAPIDVMKHLIGFMIVLAFLAVAMPYGVVSFQAIIPDSGNTEYNLQWAREVGGNQVAYYLIAIFVSVFSYCLLASPLMREWATVEPDNPTNDK